MRLSEAIRLGAMMKPQAFGSLFQSGKTCAFGAAYDAIGVLEFLMSGSFPLLDEEGQIARYRELTGWTVRRVHCPACGVSVPYFGVAHLNDTHRWTRERIADWVESIEAAQPAPNAERVGVGAR